MDFGVTQKKQEELIKRMEQLGVSDKDLEETFIRASGPGGQKVNKSSTCVCLQHIPTGLTVKMSRERSQALNRYYARKRLCELLEQQKLGKNSPSALKAEKIRKQKLRRRRRSRSMITNNKS